MNLGGLDNGAGGTIKTTEKFGVLFEASACSVSELLRCLVGE